jgi:hypothetical protein
MRSCSHDIVWNRPLVLLTFSVLLALASLSVPLRAQRSTCSQQSVFVSVEDSEGNPVAGLTAANFHASVGKESIQISLAEATPTRRIFIVLDRSGSMYESFLSHTSVLTAINLVQKSLPGVQFGFLTYNDEVDMQQLLTGDHDKVIERISQVTTAKEPWGPSAMTSAILAGLKTLSPSRPGDAVIAITDGGENANQVGYSTVEQKFIESNARLFAVLLIQDKKLRDSETQFEKEKHELEKTMEASGGEIFYLSHDAPLMEPHPKRIQFQVDKDFHNLPEIADAILKKMANSYELQISVPEDLRKASDWRLGAQRGTEDKSGALFLRYQPKLFPCTDPKSK